MVSCFNIVATTFLVASSFVIHVEAFSNLPPCSVRMTPPPQKVLTMTTTASSGTPERDHRDLDTPKTSPSKSKTTKFVLNLKKIATTSALTLFLLSPLTPYSANAVGNVVVVRDVVVSRSPSATTTSIVTSSPDVTFSPLFGGGGVGISPFGLHPFGGFGFGVRISSTPQEQELQALKREQVRLESQIQSMEERNSQLSQGKGISHKLTNTLKRLETDSISDNNSNKNNPMSVGASALKGGLPLRAVNALGRLQE